MHYLVKILLLLFLVVKKKDLKKSEIIDKKKIYIEYLVYLFTISLYQNLHVDPFRSFPKCVHAHINRETYLNKRIKPF